MCSANWRCSCTNTIQPISSVYELIQPINSVYEFDTRLALSNEKRVYGTDIKIHSWVCGNNPQVYKRPFSGPYASTLLILERPISVPQASGHAGQSQVSLFRTITGGDVGTSVKSTNAPFQDPTHAPYKYKNVPFQCLKQFGESQVSLFRPFTEGVVGTTRKSTNGPFQDLTESCTFKNAPFQCLKPQASPVNHKSVNIDQSHVRLFWSISGDTPTQRTK